VAPGADLHAGRTETSLMLHLRPDAVRLERSAAGEMRPIAEIFTELLAGGVSAVSPSGVLGDPTGANAAEGVRLLDLMVEDAARRIACGTLGSNGILAADKQQANALAPSKRS
jgi:creatinine amidohydrolase/Fe(II)-dependent formamide hydrolase-like protein